MPALLDTDVAIEILRGSRYAMETRCTLATGNTRHFSKVDGLSLVNWCRES